MSLGRRLEAAVGPDTRGRVGVDLEGQRAEVDVVSADALGVRARAVRVEGRRGPVAERAVELEGRLRALPERLRVLEVDPTLDGAILRTREEEMEEAEFWEARIDGRTTELVRQRVDPEGREQVDFTLTREQLRRLVDQLA